MDVVPFIKHLKIKVGCGYKGIILALYYFKKSKITEIGFKFKFVHSCYMFLNDESLTIRLPCDVIVL